MLAALDRLRRDPLALTITALTFVLCAIIAFDLIPALRGPAREWAWEHPRRLDLIPIRLILPIVAAGLIAGWERWTRRAPILRWWMLVTLAVRHPAEALNWLLSWGSHVRVLEPDSLREMLAREAQGMLANHPPTSPLRS